MLPLLLSACASTRDLQSIAASGDAHSLRERLATEPLTSQNADQIQVALRAAIEADSEASVDVLLEAGADPRDMGRDGWTPLHVAARSAGPAVIDPLIRAKAELNARTQSSGATPLFVAAESGNRGGVYALARAGAHVDLAETQDARRTPLHVAVEENHLGVVRLLLQAGADPYTPNSRGDSALARASARRNPVLSEMFRLALAGRAAEIPAPPVATAEASGAGRGGTRFLTQKRSAEVPPTESYSLASMSRKSAAPREATRDFGQQASKRQPARAGKNFVESPYGRRIAAVIGIDRYARWPHLEGARRDSERMANELRALGFDKVFELYDGDATRSRIISLLGQELAQETHPDDLAFIFFAGHGETVTEADGRKRGFIVPADASPKALDATGISMATLKGFSKGISARHVFYAMDSCYSGLGITRGIGVVRANEAGFIEKVTALPAVQMLTAGTEGELAIERDGEGLFTSYLVRALRGEADFDGNGVVTAGEIGVFVRPQVTAASDNRQTPQFGTLEGSGEVIFPLRAPSSAINESRRVSGE
ncbi:MAG: ankyrin repeat domain-containing protein [Myxococcota bacterium]